MGITIYSQELCHPISVGVVCLVADGLGPSVTHLDLVPGASVQQNSENSKQNFSNFFSLVLIVTAARRVNGSNILSN